MADPTERHCTPSRLPSKPLARLREMAKAGALESDGTRLLEGIYRQRFSVRVTWSTEGHNGLTSTGVRERYLRGHRLGPVHGMGRRKPANEFRHLNHLQCDSGLKQCRDTNQRRDG